MVFQILGLMILLLFYGIYFGKMIAQRKKGIQTNQMAKGSKTGKLFWTELFLKVMTYSVLIAEVVSLAVEYNTAPDFVRYAGAVIAFIGVACFAVSVYTMRDSWRAGIPEKDKTEFVTTGIYSVSRNPAFLGFDLTYIGLLFMFLNPVLLLFTCAAVIMLHLQILQEEVFLSGVFGDEYVEYKKRVGRYFLCL